MGKIALVTGCSSGIGLETSLALGREGFYTFATMRDLNKSIKLFLNKPGPSFMEVRIRNHSLNNLSRPQKLLKIKNEFIV